MKGPQPRPRSPQGVGRTLSNVLRVPLSVNMDICFKVLILRWGQVGDLAVHGRPDLSQKQTIHNDKGTNVLHKAIFVLHPMTESVLGKRVRHLVLHSASRDNHGPPFCNIHVDHTDSGLESVCKWLASLNLFQSSCSVVIWMLTLVCSGSGV